MNNKICTHHQISQQLCGHPVLLEEGHCIVELEMTSDMAADESGLIHGGFLFGMADYAAMLAVNHPNVVLGGADVKFIKPTKIGDLLQAEAGIEEKKGKKEIVTVRISKNGDIVFEGRFFCFVLDKHVLSQAS